MILTPPDSIAMVRGKYMHYSTCVVWYAYSIVYS